MNNLYFFKTLILFTVGTIILLFLDQSKVFGKEKSITISPVSFTYHPLADKAAKNQFNKTVDSSKTTTIHPGVTLQYKQKYLQIGSWFFTDSFGKLAGGTMLGVKKDIGNMVDLGLAGGVYVRETTKGINKIIGSYKNESIEVVPMLGLTTAIEVPLFNNYNPEINCLWTIKVNNCSIGLKIGF